LLDVLLPESVLNERAEASLKILPEGKIEALFLSRDDRRRNHSRNRPFEEIPRLKKAQLEGIGERNHERRDMPVQERHARFDGRPHAAAIDLLKDVALEI